jgi:hypothetical protein
MDTVHNYEKVANCHTGEIDGYGYAFIPGNKNGLVLLDIPTKQLLENLSRPLNASDKQRMKLLEERGLIKHRGGGRKMFLIG